MFHCFRGTEFRKDFSRIKEILVKAHNATVMILTATASIAVQQLLIENLEIENPLYVQTNPDRTNIFYEIHNRGPTIKQEEHLDELLGKLSSEMQDKKEQFPLTIFYTDLDTIIYSVTFFDKALPTSIRYNGEREIPENLLFNQYHQATTTRMQELIIKELSKERSQLRLVFATVALGMGLDAKHVRRIIHYKPPTSLERYIQETGRAGRDNLPARAILYHNATDTRINRPGIEDSMIGYCKSTNKCLRELMLGHLGYYPSSHRQRCQCCSVCKLVCTCDKCDPPQCLE